MVVSSDNTEINGKIDVDATNITSETSILKTKKLIMKLTAFLFYAFILIFVFSSCSKEHVITLNEENIKGVWFEEVTLEENNRISRLEYTFKDDNILEVLRIEIGKDSRDVLGYRYRTSGNYKLEGNQLSFYNLVNYCNDDTQVSFTEIENLRLVREGEGDSYTVTCKFEDNGKKLTFIYSPCGELANCIDHLTLTKD